MSEQMKELFQRGRTALRLLSKRVHEARTIPPGAYAFFHHNAHAITRLDDCYRIYGRMDRGRADLTALAYEEERVRPRDWKAGIPYPPEAQAVMAKVHDATQLMELDLESLYLFGGILLDQWALQALAIDGRRSKRGYAFPEVVELLDDGQAGVIGPLWLNFKEQLLWLSYQLRFYQNRFIVHADRPWQRGTTRSVFGDDFNLHTPTPPGWLDDAKLDAEILTLMHLAPDHLRVAPEEVKERPGLLLEALFDRIGIYEKADRETISRLFGQKGGATPNFRKVARTLLTFIADGTEALVPIAVEHAAGVALGEPHLTSAQLLEHRA